MPNDVHIKILFRFRQDKKKKKEQRQWEEDVYAIILNYDSINTLLLTSSSLCHHAKRYIRVEDGNGSENTFLQLLLQKRSAVKIYGV